MYYFDNSLINFVDWNFYYIFVGYQAAFSQLAFAGKKEHDPCANIQDAKLYLAQNLQKLSLAHPGKV